VTIMPKNIRLAQRIRGERKWWRQWNSGGRDNNSRLELKREQKVMAAVE
jgi:hypothetical protein